MRLELAQGVRGLTIPLLLLQRSISEDCFRYWILCFASTESLLSMYRRIWFLVIG